MKRFKLIFIFIILFLLTGLSGCSSTSSNASGYKWQDTTFTPSITGKLPNASAGSSNSALAYTPYSSKDCYGKNYSELITSFKNSGFTNIQVSIIYDIIIGFLASPGDVEKVTINNNSTFSKNAAFNRNALVIIEYHDWISNEPNDDEKEVIETNGIYAPITSSNAVGKNIIPVGEMFENAGFSEVYTEQVVTYDKTLSIGDVMYIELNGTKDYKTNIKYKKDVEIVIYYYVGPLTIENNDDTLKLSNLKDPADNFVASYAKAYKGYFLELDACIWAINKTSGYETRYDVLLGTKDYNSNQAYGPNIRLSCEYLGSTSFYVGNNVHIIVKIDEYNSSNELFYVSLVEINKR